MTLETSRVLTASMLAVWVKKGTSAKQSPGVSSWWDRQQGHGGITCDEELLERASNLTKMNLIEHQLSSQGRCSSAPAPCPSLPLQFPLLPAPMHTCFLCAP